jgi:hypothetical protein
MLFDWFMNITFTCKFCSVIPFLDARNEYWLAGHDLPSILSQGFFFDCVLLLIVFRFLVVFLFDRVLFQPLR